MVNLRYFLCIGHREKASSGWAKHFEIGKYYQFVRMKNPEIIRLGKEGFIRSVDADQFEEITDIMHIGDTDAFTCRRVEDGANQLVGYNSEQGKKYLCRELMKPDITEARMNELLDKLNEYE